MFKCQLSGRQSLAGQKPMSLVVARKRRSYDSKVYDLETRTVSIIKDASIGWEIVKELTVCESAYNEWVVAHPNGAEWIGEAPIDNQDSQDDIEP
jgi:hypothetical protein